MNKLVSGKVCLAASAFFLCIACKSQQGASKNEDLLNKIITVKDVKRVESTLASDDMRGRRTFTPDIDKAADFIAAEFAAAKLDKLPGANSYKQEFALIRATAQSQSAVLDGQSIDNKNILVITTKEQLKITETSGYEKVFIKQGTNLQREARGLLQGKKNLLVLVDESFANSLGNLGRLKNSMFGMDNNLVFVVSNTDPKTFTIEATHEIKEQPLANVVAMIPGKSKKDEYVVFSGHYDHLGVRKPVDGDSIYNGANDDAAGTTAMIMLAKYFKALANNERTILFAAFTAEEIGGFGSRYFSQQLDPEKVVAMFNIEMIGTDSKWGKNSAYITGYEKTDMGTMLQKNLEGSGFTFYPDPYPQQQLFYRSDNATLARLGVPAHTISTSKMDNEPNYHKMSDEVETLDLENMTEIIKAIAISSTS
ncbi:MAG TPA: M20/M25/M40 family metallo-hydrolase, partial [Chitinophagaceae bacterium]|nr:M20/M25/M40 family metallo-hydrolase [Chitinophagaceae bacterium]